MIEILNQEGSEERKHEEEVKEDKPQPLLAQSESADQLLIKKKAIISIRKIPIKEGTKVRETMEVPSRPKNCVKKFAFATRVGHDPKVAER